jgi:PEP-CTERM motif
MLHIKSSIASTLGLAIAMAAFAPQQAVAATAGVNFRDYVLADTNSGYVAGTVASETYQGFYEGQAYAIAGKAHADFGTLGISAFAASQNDGHGRPIVRLGELTKAFWQDSFTVTSGTLAAGTAVTLTFTTLVDIAAGGEVAPIFAGPFPCTNGVTRCFPTGTFTSGGLNARMAAAVALDFNDVFDPNYCAQIGTPDNDVCTPQTTNAANSARLGIGANTLTFTRLAHVGDILNLRVRFEAVTDQYNPFTFANGFAGAGFYGLNTAKTYIGVSNAAANVVAQSGHNYAITAVPEPAAWAMMLAGFGIVGEAVRRRPRLRQTLA